MNDSRHIGLFYSRGPHFGKALQYLHAQFPEARITAIVPSAFPRESLEEYRCGVLEIGDEYGPQPGFRGLICLLQCIRKARFSDFVILFPSLKQRLLARFSGARTRCCYSINGEFFPVRLALLSSFTGLLYRNVRGRIMYAYIHYIVYHCPVICEYKKIITATDHQKPTGEDV